MSDSIDAQLTLTTGVAQQWIGGAGIIFVNGTVGGATVDLYVSDDGTNYIAVGSQLTDVGMVVFAAPRNAWIKAVVAGGSPSLTIKVYREAGLHAFVQTQAGASGGGSAGDVNLAQVGGSAITKGQKTKAGSIGVTLASDEDPLSFAPADMLQKTGTITSAAVLSNFPLTDTSAYHSVAIQFTTVTAGNTAVVEESNDGTTWTALTSIGGAASVTAAGLHVYNFAAKQVRVRCSVFSSGSVTVDAEFRALKTPFPSAYGSGAIDTRTARVTLATDSPLVAATGGVSDAAWASGDGSIISVLKAIATKLLGSVAVTGTFYQATQPVSGTFWQATQPTSVADGSSITMGAKADAKSTATDTTSITAMSVWKQISFSIQAAAASLAGTLTAVIAAGTAFIGYVGHGKTLKTATINITADTDIVAAVTSKRIKVTGLRLFKTGTNANPVIFKSNGTGGTELVRYLLQSQASAVFGVIDETAAPSFLFATVAGEKLTIDVGDTDTLTGSLTYFDDDAT